MKYILMVTFLLLTVDSYAQFRVTEWGNSIEEVKEKEVAEYQIELEERGLTTLSFKGTVMNKDVSINYSFIRDTLFNATYHFNETYTDNKAYLDQFNDVKNILNEEYGLPLVTKFIWSNETYKGNENMYGYALAKGHLEIISLWESDTTIIGNYVASNDNEIKHLIDYKSKKFAHLLDNLKQKQNKFDF